MNNIIIGTAGHVDHGKTCLIRALTGIETDRLREEKKRGITIELGFAYLDLPDGGRAGIIDVPGHEKFVRNMLAGAGGIDLALLIVAADEGVMPQTVEHLGILSLLEIQHGIIVLTKIDTVDEEWRELVAEDIRQQVQGTFLQDAPLIPVSSYTGEGIEELRQEIFRQIEKLGGKKLDTPFRIPVDRVFSMEGFGTVITGTMIEGKLQEGAEVMLYPGEKLGKVRNIQVHSRSVDTAYAGQRVAVNFSNLKKTDIQRGDVVAPPGSMHTTMMVDVRLNMLKEADRSIKNTSRLHFYHGSREVLCKAVLLEQEALEPGQSGYAQLRLEETVALKAGDHFVVRFYSPLETVGGGVVLDPSPQKHKRGDAAVLESLAILEKGTLKDKIEQGVKEGSPAYRPLDFVAVQFGASKEEAEQLAGQLESEGKLVKITAGLYLHQSFLERQGKRLSEILRQYHTANPLKEGMKREELRSRFLPQQEQAVADGLLDYYARVERIKFTNGMASLFKFKVKVDEEAARMTEAMETIYRQAGYAPPTTDEVLGQMGKDQKKAQQVHAALVGSGTLVRMDAQMCFHREAYDEAVRQIVEQCRAQGQITLAEVRDLLGTSRKYAMAILDTLDREKVTKKVGDVRVLV
ncbi:MAG TPA: selenocysteine-specific translation elongation factor [Firmicutes bacterium]|nr:selenocysteine-specific translation elongation factor [Bacillota bacterium]